MARPSTAFEWPCIATTVLLSPPPPAAADSTTTPPRRRPATADLQILIGSSGDAETNAVKAAAAAWASSTGNTATVTPAQDIGQQLGQAFAGGTPPDVFYVDASRFADYASVGALEPYAEQGQGRRRRLLPVAAHRLHVPGQALLHPEGLLHADPADQHRPVGQGQAHRRRHPDHLGPADRGRRRSSRRPASRRWSSATPATGSAPSWSRPAAGSSARTARPRPPTRRRTCRRCSTCKGLLKQRLAVYPKQVDAGWGGEAFGKGKVAMATEGNWIKGAMQTDYPTVKYTVVAMPAGPSGPRARCRSPSAGASRPRASSRTRPSASSRR